MSDFFSWLFNTDSYPPRWNCGNWTPAEGWLHIISDLGVWSSYVAIPLVLGYFVIRKRNVPFRRVFLLFGAFILACGTTHLMEAIIFWWPAYRLAGFIKLFTAIVSWATVLALIQVAPRFLAMRTPEELEREIAERKRAEEELARKNQQLIEAERVKSQFFANVSHELRTPLTLILAPLESILAGEYGNVDGGQKERLGTVHNNAVRLLQMVTGLLDFSRLEAGKLEVRREPVDLAAVSRSVLGDFEPALRQKGLSIEFHSEPPISHVEMDRYLFERILFNLVSNAMKFTPPGGGVSVWLTTGDGRMKLAVRDTGIGIAAIEIPKLFQQFRQLEGSATRRFEGSGLGLALVKEFADLLGGNVSVVSKPGKGSTFTVDCEAPPSSEESKPASVDRPAVARVPRFNSTFPVAEVDGAVNGESNGQPKALIAEDNPELAAYICDLLDGICHTKTADDGEQALELARRWKPDLVLSDVMMPVRDGLSLCRALKADPATARAPFVLLTALTDRDALVNGWEAGADEYLFKPFHPRELVTRVRTLLAAATNRRLAEERDRQILREQAARSSAEESVRARDRFLAIASHELRTPLNPLRLNVHMLLREARKGDLQAGPLANRLVPMLESSERQVLQFGKLVDDLLDVSRIAAGRLELRIEEVDLAAVVKDVAIRFAPELEKAGSVLDLRATAPVVGHWDRARIEQVVTNLLSNALRYGRRKPISVSVDAGESAVRFIVRDNGIGIDPPDHARIFERFERAVTSDEFAGLGMGLFIVRQIVTAHGGTIEVESERGTGAEFRVELPYSVPKSSRSAVAFDHVQQ